MGPLHISLNSQKNFVRKFIIFQAHYNHLFKKKLAKKPKLWHVTLTLELLYSGWTLICQPVLARLQRFKDLQFFTFLNLVDNYTPLCLSIYSVFFKSNASDHYNLAMQQIWIMFLTFQRHHYDKAPLIWLGNIAYWRYHPHPLYNLLRNNIHVCDEYPVENFHSLIRQQTNEWDTPATIQRKARWIGYHKHQLQHFSSYFVPPRQAMRNHKKTPSS